MASWIDETLDAVRTIMNPRGIELDPDVMRLEEKIRNLSADEAQQVLAKAKANGRLTKDEIEVLKAILAASQSTTRQGRSALLKVKKIATSDGFKVSYLQREFRVWRSRLPSGAPDTPNDFLKDQAARAARGAGDTKLMRVLNTFLGPSFDYGKKPSRLRQLADRWPTLRLLYRPVAGRRNCALELAENFASKSELRVAVQDSLAHIEDVITRHPDQAGDLTEALNYFKSLPDGEREMANLIQDMFAKYSPDGKIANFNEAAARKLIGKRAHDPAQVIDEIVMSHLILFRELDTVHRAGVLDRSAAELFEQFMKVEGAEGFFETVLRRSGYEHGYVFEQLLAFNVLETLLKQGNEVGLAAVERIIIQSRIDDLCGPDLLILNVVDGQLVATIVQAKSYKSLRSLIRFAKGEASTVVVKGEIVLQARKDVRRFLSTGGMNQAADGAQNIGLHRYQGILHSKIDWNRLQRERLEVDPAALRSAVKDGLKTNAEKLKLKEMTHEQILSSRDPAISALVREQVHKQYLAPLAQAANAELAGLGREIADEVKNMDPGAFKALYPSPVSGPAARIHAEIVEEMAKGQGKNPDRVADLFEDYFNEFFSLTGEQTAIKIDFELVDGLIDRDVAHSLAGFEGGLR